MKTGCAGPSSVRRLAPLASALAIAASGLPGGAQAAAPLPAAPGYRADPALRVFPGGWPAVGPHAHGTAAVPATTFAVSNCADAGPGSLRAAIAAAGDGDAIDLRALACGSITLQTGAIPVRLNDLTLVGPGAAQLAIDGASRDRVFLHYGNGTLTMQALTVRNGRTIAKPGKITGGGCIASAGYVALDHSVVSGCYAGGLGVYGGAIYAYELDANTSTLAGNTARGTSLASGTASFGGAAFVYALALADSTVSGNRAIHDAGTGQPGYDIGGGIITVRGGTVAGSTFDANYAGGRGGGLASFYPLTIRNSTLSGNTARTATGGGLYVRRTASLELLNSTLTANYAGAGGGGATLPSLAQNAQSTLMQSTIAFGNVAPPGLPADLTSYDATTVAGGHNLVGAADPKLTLPPDTLVADPRLLPLADNGGPTRTHALAADSPAIDRGSNPAALAFDQRGTGYPRVVGAAADIGAFEVQAQAPPAVTPVPVLSRRAFASLIGLLGCLGLFFCRARRGFRSRG